MFEDGHKLQIPELNRRGNLWRRVRVICRHKRRRKKNWGQFLVETQRCLTTLRLRAVTTTLRRLPCFVIMASTSKTVATWSLELLKVNPSFLFLKYRLTNII
jgi:hypothetical protein